MPRKNPLQISEANLFLRTELAHLWPSITNVTKLQKQCAAVLPQLFLYCSVLYVEKEQLVVAAPNSALASKLKQQLPKLLATLQKAGWQVNEIRIKIQTQRILSSEVTEKQCQFSESALQAFAQLEKNLVMAGCNDDLLGALRTLLARHGQTRGA